MSNGKRLSVHTLTKEDSIYQSKRKRKGKDSEKEKITVAIVNICKSQPEDIFRRALATRNFHEHPLESEGKTRASGTIQNAHKRHSCAQKGNIRQRRKRQILTSEFGESKFQREIPLRECDPDQ